MNIQLGACQCWLFFFFNDTATTEIYTLSLHDALPIFIESLTARIGLAAEDADKVIFLVAHHLRSEEHTSELQSPDHIVCRLLLEKKKFKSLDTLKVKIIRVTFRRLLRTNNKKDSRILS